MSITRGALKAIKSRSNKPKSKKTEDPQTLLDRMKSAERPQIADQLVKQYKSKQSK